MTKLSEFGIVAIQSGSGVLGKGKIWDFELIQKSITEITNDKGIPFLVVSAFNGETNRLEEVYELAMNGHHDKASGTLERVLDSHFSISDYLVRNNALTRNDDAGLTGSILNLGGKAQNTLLAIHQSDTVHKRDSSLRHKASLLSFGERLSALVMKAWFQRKHTVIHISAPSVVHASLGVDRSHTNAIIDWKRSVMSLHDAVGGLQQFQFEHDLSRRPAIFLMEGSIASVSSGEIGVLPGEGGDMSNVLVSSAFGSEAYFLKKSESGLKSMSLEDLILWQKERRFHVIAEDAINEAIAHGITAVVVDVEIGEKYRFTP